MTGHGDSEQTMHKLEELSLSSWPSLKTIYYDGWIVRFANRLTNRSNSVWPIYPSSLDLKTKISACESFYSGQNQPTVFRVASTDSPPILDNLLQERNYTIVTPTSVQTLSLEDVSSKIDNDIVMETHPSDRWFDADCRLLGTVGEKKRTYLAILESIALPCCFASIIRDGDIVTVAIAVAQRDWIGLYGMFTEPTYRCQGLGRKMLKGLLSWGRSIGADKAYLHVELDNVIAVTLYEKLGFHEAYRYRYRLHRMPDV